MPAETNRRAEANHRAEVRLPIRINLLTAASLPTAVSPGGSEAQERRFSVQAKVTDAFQNPLNNVAVNVNGNSAAVSGQDGSFRITDLELDETNVLELSLDGFQTYSVDLSKYDNKKDQETDLGSIILLRNYAVFLP